jgi:hypothetical protein
MRASHWALTACALSVATGCGGAVDDPQENTGTSASAQQASPYRGLTGQTTANMAVAIKGLITFDDVPNGTQIDNHYPGVTFSAAFAGAADVYALTDALQTPAVPCSNWVGTQCPPTGNSVVFKVNNLNDAGIPLDTDPFISGYDGGVKAVFASPKRSVSIMTYPHVMPGAELLGPVNNRPFLLAYMSDGSYVEEIYPFVFDPNTPVADPSAATGWGSYQTITVNAPAGVSITSVVFSTQNSQGGVMVYGAFDNLSYLPP